MLRIALIFFIVAIIAGIFGFGGVASTSAGIAQFFFFLFAVVFLLSLIFGLIDRRNPPAV